MAEVKERIAELMFKFLKKDLSPDEERELNAWISSSETNRELFERLTNEESFHSNVREIYSYKTEAWKKIESETGVGRVVYMRRRWIRWVAAASVLLVMSYGLWVMSRGKATRQQGSEATNAIVHDVPAPTGTKAMITLADGTKVYLDSVNNGTIAQENNVDVVKNENGEIIYSHTSTSLSAGSGAKAQSEIVYNTLSNPRGSKVINMELSDGSHVWLNAGSSVTYPVAFIGNDRKVEITGEAYFEVTHDASKPFHVKKGNTDVTVLGTHFNVNAYDDESDIKVTLLEGSVKVSNGNANGLMKPGQQAQVGNGVKVVSDIDVDEVMAWKNNQFIFNRQDIKSIMRQIARWYDVEVSYKGNNSGATFSGIVSRGSNVSQVLNIMEQAGMKFTIDGKKITVMQ